MGEIFCNNKSRLIILISAAFLLLSAAGVHASYQELDLFNKGYEYYLSYQPEKAVEEFNIFLREFPHSSSRDAVMFWLGKSLVQLKYFEEAEKVFSDIKQQIPGSPFIKYAEKELDAINKRPSDNSSGVLPGKPVAEVAPAKVEEKITPIEPETVNKTPSEDKAAIVPEGKASQGEVKKEQTAPVAGPAVAEDKIVSIETNRQEKPVAEVAPAKAEEKITPIEPEIANKTLSEDKAVTVPEGKASQGEVKKEQTAPVAGPAVAANKTVSAENSSPEKPVAEVGPAKAEEKITPVEPEIVNKAPSEDKAVTVPADSKAQGEVKKEQTAPVAGPAVAEDKIVSIETNRQEKPVAEVAPAKAEEKITPIEPEIANKTQSEDKVVTEPAGDIIPGDDAGKKNSVAASSAETENKTPAAERDHQQKPDKELDSDSTGKKLPPENNLSESAVDKDNKVNMGEVPSAGEEKKTEENQEGVKEQVDREVYAGNSSFVLTSLGVKGIPWRNGNISEDMENEKILYMEAMRLNITADAAKHRELVEKYGFNQGQSDYLLEYLTICELIDRKLKDLPGEKVVESLAAVYEEGDKYKKIVMSADLQTEAKNGMSFEDIHNEYPDLLRFAVTGFEALDAGIKEKIRSLRTNEIGVIWSDEGYTILKPVFRKLSFKHFEEAGPAAKERIKVFVGDLLNELRVQGR